MILERFDPLEDYIHKLYDETLDKIREISHRIDELKNAYVDLASKVVALKDYIHPWSCDLPLGQPKPFINAAA